MYASVFWPKIAKAISYYPNDSESVVVCVVVVCVGGREEQSPDHPTEGASGTTPTQ